jgi:hypothetical protein
MIPLNNKEEKTVVHEGTVDVAVDSLLAPAADSVYTAFEEIAVRLVNHSTGALDSFPLFYCINDRNPVFQPFETFVDAGDTIVLHFDAKADMADTGEYILAVYSALPQDADRANDTVCVRLYNTILGMKDPVFAGEIRLYPNPAGERITLRPSFRGEGCELILLDMSGRKWFVRKDLRWTEGEEITIPLQGLSPGTYFILLTDGRRKVSLPFVKR